MDGDRVAVVSDNTDDNPTDAWRVNRAAFDYHRGLLKGEGAQRRSQRSPVLRSRQPFADSDSKLHPASLDPLKPAIRKGNAFALNEAKGEASHNQKSNSVLDWLRRRNSEPSGKRLVPSGPQRIIRRGQHDEYFGLGYAGPYNSEEGQLVSSDRDLHQHEHLRGHPSVSYPSGLAYRELNQNTTGTPYQHDVYGGPNTSLPRSLFEDKPTAADLVQESPDPESMAFDVIHDPSDSTKKDVIFRLSLPIEEDFQPNLEEFCRFRRLGRFKDAKEHFQSKLNHLIHIPYVLVQYAEMLLASGDYKSFRALPFQDKYPSLESEENEEVKDRALDMLEGNFWLLDFLARVPQPTFNGNVFQAIINIVGNLQGEPVMGSTETQMLSICLSILGHLKNNYGVSATKELADDYVKGAFKWNEIYHRLLGEDRIWDLRDILATAVPLFGPRFLSEVLGVPSFRKALDKICEDWQQDEHDESTALGLLDLFTSMLLESPTSIGEDRQAGLLFEYSKRLAESIQTNNPQNMKTRPFIQWILAKAIFQMGPVPKRPDGLTLQDFSGLLVSQGHGVHLPVFFPVQPSDKPHWDMFSVRSNPEQRQALQVALQAARFTGDYRLQATCLKLLILHSREPMALMNALATFQFDTQGDYEGFLGTCLSKYIALASDDGDNRATLIYEFEELRNIMDNDIKSPGNMGFYEPNSSLLWARDVITRILVTSNQCDGGQGRFVEDNIEFWSQQLRKYGARLPQQVADFIRTTYNIRVPPPIQAPIPEWPPRIPSPRGSPTLPKSSGPAPLHPRPRGDPEFAYRTGVAVEARPDHYETWTNSATLVEPGNNPFDPLETRNSFPPRHNPFSPADHDPFAPADPIDSVSMPRPPKFQHSHSSDRQHRRESSYYGVRPPAPPVGTSVAWKDPIVEDHRSSSKTANPFQRDTGLVTGALPRKKTDRNPKASRPARKKIQRTTTTTIHVYPSDSGEEYSDSYNNSSYSESIGSDSIYIKRYKPSAPEPSDSEPSGLDTTDNEDDFQQDEFDNSEDNRVVSPLVVRNMSPQISFSEHSQQQILKIASEVLGENEVSILMPNTEDPTKSKAYIVRNGAIHKTTIAEATASVGIPPDRTVLDPSPSFAPTTRSKSQSSLRTVRPQAELGFRPPGGSGEYTVRRPSRARMAASVDEEAPDDETSTMNGRVKKANDYINNKTDEWVRDNSRRMSKQRPTIIQPKPVRPSAPGDLAKGILTDDEEHEGEEATPNNDKYQPPTAEDAAEMGSTVSGPSSADSTALGPAYTMVPLLDYPAGTSKGKEKEGSETQQHAEQQDEDLVELNERLAKRLRPPQDADLDAAGQVASVASRRTIDSGVAMDYDGDRVAERGEATRGKEGEEGLVVEPKMPYRRGTFS